MRINLTAASALGWCIAFAPLGVVSASEGRSVGDPPVSRVVEVAFDASRACFNSFYLALAANESKRLGAPKDSAAKVVGLEAGSSPVALGMVDLGYSVDRATDPALKAVFTNCLNAQQQNMQKILR